MNNRIDLNISRATLVLLAFLIFKPLQGQQDFRPDSIVSSFYDQLDDAIANQDDTLEIYSLYLQKLVNRGNYLYADTLFNRLDVGIPDIADSSQLKDIYRTRAYMYKVQRRFPKSLQDYLWLKSYYEREQDYQMLIQINNEMAEYYRAIQNLDLCDRHLKEAKKLFDLIEPTRENLAYWYSRKAAWANEGPRYLDSVVYYAEIGLDLAMQTDDIYTQALLLNELGYSNMSRRQPEEITLDYYNRAKDILFENQYYRYYTDVVNNMVNYYWSKEEYDQSLSLAEEILAIQEANMWYEPMEPNLIIINAIYQKQGNTEKYIEGLEKLYNAKVNNRETSYKIAINDNQLNYEKELAKKDLIVQEERAQLAESEAQINRQAFFISLGVAILLLLIVLISFYINLRFRRKNELLEEKSKEIEQSNTQLAESLDLQKTLYQELHHRVKNNLSILNGLIYMQEVEEKNSQSQESFERLRVRVKSMALAHESLYRADRQEKIEFHVYLEELFNDLSLSFADAKKVTTEIECEGYELGLIEAIPLAMIMNEFFTNSVKHAFSEIEKGIVSIKCEHVDSQTIIEYRDNGKGYNKNQKDKTTLGLKLVHLLMKQLNAQFEDKTSENGVYYRFVMPEMS